MSDLKILLTADLNVAQTTRDINAAIEKVQAKITKLKLKIDTKTLSDAGVILKGLNDNINKANSRIEQASNKMGTNSGKVVKKYQEDIKEVEKAIRRVNDEIGKSTPKKYTVNRVVDENGKKQIQSVAVQYTNEFGKTITKHLGWASKKVVEDVNGQLRETTVRTFRQLREVTGNSTVQASKKMDSLLNQSRQLQRNLENKKTNIFDKGEEARVMKAYQDIERKILAAKGQGNTLRADTIKGIDAEIAKMKELTAQIIAAQKQKMRLDNLGKTVIGDTKNINFNASSSVLNEQMINEVKRQLSSQLGREIGDKDIAVSSMSIDRTTGQAVAKLTADIATGKNEFKRYKVNIDEASQSIRILGESLRTTANRNLSFLEKFKIAMQSIPIWMAGMTAFYQTLHFFTDGIAYVNELNKSLTEMSIVLGQSQAEVEQYGKQWHDLGMEMSIATEEIGRGAVEFARQGLTGTEMMERMSQAIVYAKISNIDFNESAKILTATVNSMGVSAERAADVYSYMGDATATGADEIGQAMQRVGGTAGAIGLEFEKVSSWIATVSARTRESSYTIGNSIKSIIARVQSLRENGFDEEDGTQVNQVSKALAQVGIQLVDAQGNFRNFGDVMDELGAKWDGLTAREQAYLATTVAGSYQQSRFMNIMEGYSDSVELYENSLDKAGIAQEKFNLYQEGTEAHLTRMKNAWTGVFQSSFDSEGIRSLADALTGIATVIDTVVQKFGLFPIVVGLATTALYLLGGQGFKSVYQAMIPSMAMVDRASLSFRAFTTSVSMAVLAMKGSPGAILSMRYSMTALTATVRAAAAAVGAFMLSLAPLAAIVGITFAIEKLTSKYMDHKRALEEMKTVSYEQANQYRDQKKAIEDLRKEYEYLSNTQNKTVEEKQRLLDIQYELAREHGVTATGIDAEGKAYAAGTEVIEERISVLEDLIKKEQELNKTRLLAQETENRKNIKDAKASYDENKRTLDDLKKQRDDFNKGVVTTEKVEVSDSLFPFFKYETEVPIDIEYLNTKILEAEKELDASYTSLQENLANRTQVLVDEYSEFLRSSGKAVSGEQREFISYISNIVGQMDVGNLENQVEKIDEVFKNLQGLGVQNSSQLKEMFAANDMEFNTENVQRFNDMLNVLTLDATKNMNVVEKQSLAYDFYGKRLDLTRDKVNDFVNAVLSGKPIIDNSIPVPDKVIDYNKALEELNKSQEDMMSTMGSLNGLLEKHAEGKSISADEAMNLVAKESSLIDMFKIENGQIKLNTDAIKEKRDEFKKAIDDESQALRTQLINQNNALVSKLEMYGIEIDAINGVKNALTGKAMTTDEAITQIGEGAYSEAYHAESLAEIAHYQKQASNARDFLLQLENLKKRAELAKASLTTVGTSTNKDKNKNEIDQFEGKDSYEKELNRLNAEISRSQSLQGTLDKLGEAYRKQVSTESSLQAERQKTAKDAAAAYRLREAAIQKELKGMPAWNAMSDKQKEKSNELKQELEGVADAITNMSEVWWDAQARINANSWELAQSRIGEIELSINKVSEAIELSSAKLSAYNEESKEYRNELNNQIELNKKKQQELHKEAEAIRAILKENEKLKNLSSEQVRDLTSKVNGLSAEWWNLEASIRGAVESLADFNSQVAEDAIELVKEMYEKQKDAVIKAMEEQEKVLDKAHKKEMDRIDEKLKADQKIIDSKIKQLEMDRDEEDYNSELAKKNQERQEIQNRINRLAMDNSAEGQAALRELRQKQKELDEEIAKMQRDHTIDKEKQNYEDQKDALEERAELEKESWTATIEVWDAVSGKMIKISGKTYEEMKEIIGDYKDAANKHFEDIFNNEKYWSDLKKDIESKNIEEIKGKLGTLKTWFDENLPIVGQSIYDSLTMKFQEVIDKLKELRTEASIIADMQQRSSDWFGASPEDKAKLEQEQANDASLIGATKGKDGLWYGSDGKPLYGSQNPSAPNSDASVIAKMKANGAAWASSSPAQQKALYEENQRLGKSIGATYNSQEGVWYRNGVRLFHKGGVVGGSTNGNSLLGLVNSMMNKDANEQVVMALKDELFMPSKNITSKFLPNMKKLMSSITPNVKVAGGGDTNISIVIESVVGNEDGANKVATRIIKELKKKGQ